MPAKKPKEAPAIVEGVSPAGGAEARLSAVRLEKTEVTAPNDDAPDWRGTCAICLDLLPVDVDRQTFYECCCNKICTACSDKCRQHDARCPLCRTPASNSDAEWVRRLQKHVDKGNVEAQFMLGIVYRDGGKGFQQNFKRAAQLYELAAVQGNADAQTNLGFCYTQGQGVEMDHKAAALWYRRAAKQGFPAAQFDLGLAFDNGKGVAQSHDEAVRWYRLAAAQGDAKALFNLGVSYENGEGVVEDYDEALRLYKRAAAKGHAGATVAVAELVAFLAAARAP
jgi:TPR repeat protein